MKQAFLLSSIFLLLGEILLAQKSPGKVISPVAGTTVPNEELFIVFQKNKELRWESYTLQVYVDDANLSTLVKISGDLLTVLATHRMKPGEHEITVRFSAEGAEPLVAKWSFNVAGRKNPLPAAAPNQPAFSMRSDLHLQSRLTDLSGPGQFLRQEPASLHTVNFLGSAFHKKLEIPFRFYVTNQEKSSLQWRNTYMVGLKTKRLGLFAGDVFPNYHRHLLNGSKIRGGRAYVKLRNTTFDVSYGSIQRSLEGELRQYDVALGFPPVNLETSTGLYVVPGSYSRDVLAAQLRFDGKGSKEETTLSFLRGTDRASSIQYGGPPGQNIVFGFGHKTASKNGALELDLGVSISMTTRDTRGGAATSEEIDGVYGREPPVNPSSVENIFTLNLSTTPYRITGLPSASAFANLRLNVLRQHFTMQYERVGGAFYSYGMPFLINDRRTIAVGDWAHLWEKRIMLSANYRYYVNNLSEEKPTTQATGNLQTSLRFSPDPDWPQLTFSFNDFRRNGEDVFLKKTVLKRTIQTYTASLHHAFPIGSTKQSASLSYSRNNRLDELRENSDFFTNALNARLSSDLPAGFQVTLEYQFLLLSNDTSDFNRQNGYGLRLRYQTPNKKFNVSAGARQFRTAETFFTPEANRRLFDGRAEFFIRNDLSFSIQVGRSEYEEVMVGNRNYEEVWGEAGLRYRLR
ncbi:MAG: hypothetical protein HY842_05645 [Bacteroidetes bacterium]|nr:hypothetical protein [Bacteroidota bacterium]